MWRTGRFRTFKPAAVCECSHLGYAHAVDANGARTGRCRLCPCSAMKPKKKPNKYHAIKQEHNGIRYDSKFEARVAADLDYQLRCGAITSIERQVRFNFIVNGVKLKHYWLCDFLVTLPDGSRKAIEAKGFPTPVWQIKRALFEVLYPDIQLEVRTQ